MSNLNVSTVNATQMTTKTFTGSIYTAEGKIAKKTGKSYIQATIPVDNGLGNGQTMWLKACIFPPQEQMVTYLNTLTRNRIVTVTGSYKEREYEGKDGTMKVAYEMLVNNIKVGGVREVGTPQGTTMEFIEQPKNTSNNPDGIPNFDDLVPSNF